MPILPLARHGIAAVSKRMQPTSLVLVHTAHILETFARDRVLKERIGKLRPGTTPFRIVLAQPSHDGRILLHSRSPRDDESVPTCRPVVARAAGQSESPDF